jgi:tetratricopeptide (TPR) repeat protein
MIYVRRGFKQDKGVSWSYRKAFKEAIQMAETGRYHDSDKVFGDLIARGGDVAEALLHRAFVRLRMGRLNDALLDAQRALEQRPDNGVYYMVLGDIQAELKDWAACYGSFKKATELEKDNGRALFGLGKAALNLGRKHEAADHFESALAFERNYVLSQWMVESFQKNT